MADINKWQVLILVHVMSGMATATKDYSSSEQTKEIYQDQKKIIDENYLIGGDNVADGHISEDLHMVLDSNLEHTSDSGQPLERMKRSTPSWEESKPEGDERWTRAAISRQTTDNQLHRPRNRNRDAKRRKVRVTEVEELVKAAIAATVSSALRQELEPLHTALRIVRLDTFSEGIVRQLGTLEHIQSKLLTEYGEMREAVTQASRTAQDLAQQVASLDSKVGSLTRVVQTASSSSSSGSGNSASGASFASGGPSRAEELKAVLMQASTAFSARLTATERRVKDDLGTLENRMTEAMKRSQLAFDNRLSSITADTNKILNRTCYSSDDVPPSQSFINTNKLFSLDDAPHQVSKFPFPSGSPSIFSSTSHRSFPSSSVLRTREQKTRDDQTATIRQAVSSTDRQQQQSTSTLLPFPSWSRSEMMNLAAVTRMLATEIASHISKSVPAPPRDCADIALQGETVSGVYTIYPAACSARVALKVWCELEADGGGWTVMQRRGLRSSGRDDFFRDWAEYKWGFGDLETDHWIGNEYIYQLTSSGDYELRIDLKDWSDEDRWAVYRHFYISEERSNYTLHIGDYKGNAGNSLKYHQGAPFSTKDRDNDINPMSHCARTFHGAWWFIACHESHLNGRYHRSPHRTYGDGINWMTFRGLNYSHKFSRMMVRPTTSASSLQSSTIGVSTSSSLSSSLPSSSGIVRTQMGLPPHVGVA